MTKSKRELPFNDLPLLPPKVELMDFIYDETDIPKSILND